MGNLLDTLAGTGNGVVTNSSPPPPTPPTVSFIPYDARIDPQADTFLPWMWKRMQQDDLVDYYFPGQRDTGFATFVRFMSGEGGVRVALVGVPHTSKQWSDTVAGFVSWTPMYLGASAMTIGGFIFFHKFWGRQVPDETARAAFAYWFDGEHPVQAVLGVCPALHTLAIRYNERIGLHEVGRLPMAHLFKGTPCDAILYAITRNEWETRCR